MFDMLEELATCDGRQRSRRPVRQAGDGALLGLGIHLRGASTGDPLEAANSPEVIEFNRGSIARWTEAIESSGTATTEEVAGARQVAVAQYTTPPA